MATFLTQRLLVAVLCVTSVDIKYTVTLYKLFELIIRNDTSVIKEIKTAVDNSVDVFSTFGFSARKGESLTDVCDCRFDFEQFSFIKASVVNEERFQNVLENIKAGKCAHVKQQDSQQIATGVGLFHAAAATGNVDLLRYLITLQKSQIVTLTSCGLQPIHIGTLQNQGTVVEVLVKLLRHSEIIREYERENKNIILYKDLTIEKLQVFKSCYALLTRLIATLDIVDDTISLFKTNLIDRKRLLIDFIDQKRERDADQILTDFESESLRIDKWHIVKCMLFDYDTVLSKLLRFDVITYECESELYYGDFGTYNGCTLLDIATAFGSAKCIELLKEHPDYKKESYVSSNVSPYTLVCKMIDDSDTSTKSMNELLIICKARGYDINKADHEQKTPLLYAIYSMRSDETTVIQRLLKDGADVNQGGHCKTPLAMTVKPNQRGISSGYLKRFRPVMILKSLLFCIPSIPQTPPSCFRFALFTDTQNKHLYHIQEATLLRYKPRLLDANLSEAVIYIPVNDENKILAASRAALLFECGYEMTADDIEYIKSDDFRSLGRHYKPYLKSISKEAHRANFLALSKYFDTKSKTVRSLKSTCRNVLRKTYSGNLIKRFVQLSIIPQNIIEYLLMCKELGSFEYEIQNNNGEKEIFVLDNETVYSEARSNKWLYQHWT